MTVMLQDRLGWQDVARVAAGESLALSDAAWARVSLSAEIVQAIVDSGVRAYGITTGVGALSDTVVSREEQGRLSHHILLSHAASVGPLLPDIQVRAIIAAQIANFAHGHSGVRPEIVAAYLAFLDQGVVPDVPSRGSVGYLVHNAAIALPLIGEGSARVKGVPMTGGEALRAIGRAPLQLRAKEGLSLVNGSACATGLAALALDRATHLLDWADAIAALSAEAAGCQMAAFGEAVTALRPSPGMAFVAASLRARLAGSGLIAGAEGRRTQDALSIRSIPHMHGAARDLAAECGRVVDQELASVTDNPALSGTPEAPVVTSEAHAVAPALGLSMDMLATAMAQLSQMSERRLDRLINPLVSGLPPFLATDAGSHSGFMIAQYTAAGLASENRRLAQPAALDGGVTSGLQEDFLAHPTSAAQKCLSILDNTAYGLAIELMAAAQAVEMAGDPGRMAPGTAGVHRMVRAEVAPYRDDRPLHRDMERLKRLIEADAPPPAGA